MHNLTLVASGDPCRRTADDFGCGWSVVPLLTGLSLDSSAHPAAGRGRAEALQQDSIVPKRAFAG